MDETYKHEAAFDRSASPTLDLIQRLTTAELLAEAAEKNALAAERARAVMQTEFRAAQAEYRAIQTDRDKLKDELDSLKKRIAQVEINDNRHSEQVGASTNEAASYADAFFSSRLFHPLGKIADFELFYQEDHAFVIHPFATEIVVVQISCFPTEPIFTLKLEVSLPDERAQLIEYVLITAGDSTSIDFASDPKLIWNVLAPGENAEISVHWPVKVKPAVALICVRPVDPQKGHDYCGTVWRLASSVQETY